MGKRIQHLDMTNNTLLPPDCPAYKKWNEDYYKPGGKERKRANIARERACATCPINEKCHSKA